MSEIPSTVESSPKFARRGLAAFAGAVGVAVATSAATRPAEAAPTSRNFVASVAQYGARGDGKHDDTAAIQRGIDAVSEAGGGELRVPTGTYRTTAPLTMKSRVRLVGEGDASVLKADKDKDFGGGRAVIEMDRIESTAVAHLKMDQGGTGRNAFVAKVSHAILITQSSDIDLLDITFVETGYESDYGWPGGPVVYMHILEAHDRPVERVNITQCRFIQPDNLHLNFAIRATTDFLTADPKGRCNRVVVSHCHFEGTWGWNTVEFAGPGTSDSSVIGCTFDGISFTHIDFDKGVSNCIAAHNHILSAGKPPHLISNPNTRVAAINDHGNYNAGAGHRNANNIIAHNTITNTVTDGGIDTKESAITVAFSTNSLVVGNQITNVNNGTLGGGIHIQRDVTDCAIRDNYVSDVKYGIWFDDNFADFNGIRIEGNQVSSTAESIYVNKLPEHGKDFVITNNQVAPGANHAGIGFVAHSAEMPVVAHNTCEGGKVGIDIGDNDAVVIGNVVKRADTSFAAAGDRATTLIGNASITPGGDDLSGATGRISLVGNLFSGAQSAMGAPTSYGASAPSAGDWVVGSVIHNSEPASGANTGWVCVAAGSPGTWKSMGTIA